MLDESGDLNYYDSDKVGRDVVNIEALMGRD